MKHKKPEMEDSMKTMLWIWIKNVYNQLINLYFMAISTKNKSRFLML